jgi:hypothetical protein
MKAGRKRRQEACRYDPGQRKRGDHSSHFGSRTGHAVGEATSEISFPILFQWPCAERGVILSLSPRSPVASHEGISLAAMRITRTSRLPPPATLTLAPCRRLSRLPRTGMAPSITTGPPTSWRSHVVAVPLFPHRATFSIDVGPPRMSFKDLAAHLPLDRSYDTRKLSASLPMASAFNHATEGCAVPLLGIGVCAV